MLGGVGVGAFIQLFPSSLLTAHPELGSCPEISMDSSSVCRRITARKYISRAHHECFCLFVFASFSACDCVFPHPTVVGGAGGA